MARKRKRMALCPLCEQWHEVQQGEWLYSFEGRTAINEAHWIGFKTVIHCHRWDVFARVYKLYDESYHYVGCETRWYDDSEIPF